MNVVAIRRSGEIFVTPVLMKQKYAVDVNNGKAFLNLKRIRKALLIKYQEGVSVEGAANGNDPYPRKQERNLKKQIHSHP